MSNVCEFTQLACWGQRQGAKKAIPSSLSSRDAAVTESLGMSSSVPAYRSAGTVRLAPSNNNSGPPSGLAFLAGGVSPPVLPCVGDADSLKKRVKSLQTRGADEFVSPGVRDALQAVAPRFAARVDAEGSAEVSAVPSNPFADAGSECGDAPRRRRPGLPRIAFLALGEAADVMPFLALAATLQRGASPARSGRATGRIATQLVLATGDRKGHNGSHCCTGSLLPAQAGGRLRSSARTTRSRPPPWPRASPSSLSAARRSRCLPSCLAAATLGC